MQPPNAELRSLAEAFVDRSRIGVEFDRIAGRFDGMLARFWPHVNDDTLAVAEGLNGMRRAFSADVLHRRASDLLAQRFAARTEDARRAEVVLDWLGLPETQQVWRALDAAWRDKAADNEVGSRFAAGLDARSFSVRWQRVRVRRFLRASGDDVFLAEVTLALSRGVLRAKAVRLGRPETEADAIIEQARGAMVAGLKAMTQMVYLYAFRDLPTPQIDAYRRFCASEWGQWYGRLTMETVVTVYREAGDVAGSLLQQAVRRKAEG